MGRSRGLEPPTSGTTNRRSNQLSYDRHISASAFEKCRAAGPVKAARRAVKPLPTRASANCIACRILKAKTASKCNRRKIISRLALGLPGLITVAVTHGGDSSAQRLLQQRGMQRVPTPKAEIFQLRGFVPGDLARELIGLIETERRPSTIADDNGDKQFRTSETCDLAPEEPAVSKVEQLLYEINGIDPRFGEPLQGQRYDIGQEFKAHSDWFNPGGTDYLKYCSVSGQRTWTFMIYLNDVEAGGGTRFKAIGKTFKPEAGKLLCWNNRTSDLAVNPDTIHHGMKVRQGVKYILTKWYREKEWG